MNQPATGQQIKQLNNSVKRLTRVVENFADTLRNLNAYLESQSLPGGEPETETHQSELDDQPIILTNDDFVYVTVCTVHGVQETIKLPRRNL